MSVFIWQKVCTFHSSLLLSAVSCLQIFQSNATLTSGGCADHGPKSTCCACTVECSFERGVVIWSDNMLIFFMTFGMSTWILHPLSVFCEYNFSNFITALVCCCRSSLSLSLFLNMQVTDMLYISLCLFTVGLGHSKACLVSGVVVSGCVVAQLHCLFGNDNGFVR
jgi:hypothetical protein